MHDKDARLWSQRMQVVKERLREPLHWYPFPLLISFAVVLLLTAHVVFGTNPRMGNPANVMTFPSQPRHDSDIWMSVSPSGHDIVVTTSDRRVFRWRQDVANVAGLAPFVSYLKSRAADEVRAAALLKHAFRSQTSAVIAVDQSLKFLHVRPILYALAAAGISQYAFETQNPTVATSDAPTNHPH